MARKREWSVVTVKQLEAFRSERSLTVAQLAKLLGTTATSVHNWKRGQNVPTLRTQEKIRALIEPEQPSTHPTEQPEPPQANRLSSPVLLTGRITAAYLSSQGKRMSPDELAQLVARVRKALQ